MVKQGGVILIIDDEDGRVTKRMLGTSIESTVRHPNDVTASDLRKAKLVLVDYKLEHWPQRDVLATPSLKPKDGISLIAVLRSNLAGSTSPVAFALNSGALKQLNAGRDPNGSEHAIARAIDVEWVFSKGSNREHFPLAVSRLAEAVKSLPKDWTDSSKTRDMLNDLLAVPSRATWRQSAIEAIDRSYPPHDIMIGNGSGIAVLRWLLHVILPYPTFLLDERYLAARLWIEPTSFSRLMKTERDDIRRVLGFCEYKGILNGFAGLRWWRPGIEQWIWDNTKGKAFDREAVQQLVADRLTRKARFSELNNPVISVSSNLQPSDDLTELSEAVEIKPDGWPPFAECAWIAAVNASDPAFVGLIPQIEKNKF
ncbi:hypothetical protein ACQR13_29315 [Bradyrhizobium sp. HKCCYLRH3059]|uniref:hypothetical protein n=1 Tax=Bradyrhizobium sp. HKCCYLRH3059 TaxID=3420745 RepID=UPI003EBD854E